MRCPLPGKQGAEQRLYLNYEQVKGLVPSSSPPPRFFYFYLQIPLFARVAARRLICPASRLINACRRTRYPQMPFSLFSAWHCLLDHKVFCKIKKTSKTHCTSNAPENYKKTKVLILQSSTFISFILHCKAEATVSEGRVFQLGVL